MMITEHFVFLGLAYWTSGSLAVLREAKTDLKKYKKTAKNRDLLNGFPIKKNIIKNHQMNW